MIDIKDVPSEQLNRIREVFNESPAVQRLRVQQGLLIHSGKYVEAANIGKQLEALYQETVYKTLKEASDECERMDMYTLSLPDEVKERIIVLGIAIFMCCDMIESAVMDIDDILAKYEDDMHLEMFNDLIKLKELAKGKIEFLSKNSDYMKDFVWGDRCDDMYEMLRNKAAFLVRKQKEKEASDEV